MDEDLLENSNKLLAVIPAVKPKGKPSAATTYTIGGVKVDFPVKAYPSQISMMNQVGGRFFNYIVCTIITWFHCVGVPFSIENNFM